MGLEIVKDPTGHRLSPTRRLPTSDVRLKWEAVTYTPVKKLEQFLPGIQLFSHGTSANLCLYLLMAGKVVTKDVRQEVGQDAQLKARGKILSLAAPLGILCAQLSRSSLK